MKYNFSFLSIILFGIFGFGQIQQQFSVDENGRLNFNKIQSDSNHHWDSNGFGPADLELDWSSPDFDVSNNPSVDSWDTHLAISPDNTVNIVYNDNHSNGLQKIMYRKKTGDNWSDPIYVDTGSEIGGRNNHMPVISAAPNGDLHVIYTVWAYSNFRNYMGYSHYDATNDTWSEGVKISDVEGTIEMNGINALYSTEDSQPVAIWGYDNREDTNVEEIYMTYFDGENWSDDIAVSQLSDGLSAFGPAVTGIGNQKAIIFYREYTGGSSNELRYRIYDEVSHELSDPKVVDLGGIQPVYYLPLLYHDGKANILFTYKAGGQEYVKIAEYDSDSDSFLVKDDSKQFPDNTLRRYGWDCNQDGDCGIIFTDFVSEKISYMAYSPDSGFSDALTIVNQDPQIDPPFAGFDSFGNLHISWSDLRFDTGGAFMHREIFYKEGKNLNMGVNDISNAEIQFYPNPSNGKFTIQTDRPGVIELFDMNGRKLENRRIQKITNFDLSLPDGVYVLKFNDGKQIQTRKLLIKNN